MYQSARSKSAIKIAAAVSAAAIFLTWAYAKDHILEGASFKNRKNINAEASESGNSNRLSDSSDSGKVRLKVEELRYLMKIL